MKNNCQCNNVLVFNQKLKQLIRIKDLRQVMMKLICLFKNKLNHTTVKVKLNDQKKSKPQISMDMNN